MTNLLYAHILLDRSGSMESCRDVTIDAFNEYVSNLASDSNIDAAISLSLFDGQGVENTLDLQLVHNGINVKTMPKLTRETYVPRGNTPLNDAIGRTVARMDGEWHRPNERIALVIITDGYENASTEYNTTAIKKLLDSCKQDKNWLIVYLGANQDAFQEGSVRGVSAMNTMNYAPQHVKAAMRATARSHASFAASGSAHAQSVGFSQEEREEAMGTKKEDRATP